MGAEYPFADREIQQLIFKNAQAVFSTMLELDIEQIARAEPDPPPGSGKSVIALLGFTGAWSGTGMIQCSEPLACLIGSKLFLSEFSEVNDEVLDAIGEVTNMVIGNFKEDAADQLGPLNLGTPTVIFGDNFQTRMWQGHQWIEVPLCCEGETFRVRVCLVAQRDSLPSHERQWASHP